MLDRVNEDLDTGSTDLGCSWRFCRHAAGIAESEDGQDHRYIQPVSGLVGRLDAIAAGRAGQGLHLMLSNTQCQPDGGFHWFAVAAWYTSASEAPIAAGGAAEGGGAVDDPPRGDGEADPAGPDTPRAAEAPTVVPARPGPADRDVDTTPSQAPPGAGGGEIAAVGAPEPTPLMPPPPPAAEAAAQKAGDAGPGSGVPLLQALQPGVRRTMPRAASTVASGVAAASRAAATHGLGGGADLARVRSNRQLQNARKRAKQLE